MLTPYQILKMIIFLDLKDIMLLARDIICLWLVYYRYQEAQARKAVQLYYVLLATVNKDRLYKEFRKPNFKIYILVSFNILVYGTNISNIKRVIQYYMPKNKSINIIWQ